MFMQTSTRHDEESIVVDARHSPKMDGAFRTVHHRFGDFAFVLFALLFFGCRHKMILTALP
jgi:hypothetical protein